MPCWASCMITHWVSFSFSGNGTKLHFMCRVESYVETCVTRHPSVMEAVMSCGKVKLPLCLILPAFTVIKLQAGLRATENIKTTFPRLFCSWLRLFNSVLTKSHEIKRCLLLGRKTMTYLDSMLNNRDITLPTKVHIVKAMAFPVVMYGCES